MFILFYLLLLIYIIQNYDIHHNLFPIFIHKVFSYFVVFYMHSYLPDVSIYYIILIQIKFQSFHNVYISLIYLIIQNILCICHSKILHSKILYDMKIYNHHGISYYFLLKQYSSLYIYFINSIFLLHQNETNIKNISQSTLLPLLNQINFVIRILELCNLYQNITFGSNMLSAHS